MKTILIIDDEKDIRDMLKVRFEYTGYKCLTAKEGQEGIELAKKEKPSLIIMDLIMPKMDGVQTYKALKAEPTTKHIPIIAYTAQDPEIVAKKGMEAFDVIDFVFKPFDAKALTALVDKALKDQEVER